MITVVTLTLSYLASSDNTKVNKAVKDENGFAFTTKTGIYGTDYLMRALVTAIGLGANRPQDAVYPTSQRATSTMAQTSTSCGFQKATCRPRRDSGHSRCTTTHISSWTIR